MAKAKDTEITGTALAAEAYTTRETIGDYRARGIIEQLPNGKYLRSASIERIFKHLRAQSSGHSGELTAERIALAKEQREAAAFKNAVNRGEYVLRAAVTRTQASRYGVARTIMLSVPGKLSGRINLTPDQVLIVEEEIYEALNELANPASYRGERVVK